MERVPDGFIEIARGVRIAQALHHTASPDTQRYTLQIWSAPPRFRLHPNFLHMLKFERISGSIAPLVSRLFREALTHQRR